MRTRNTAFQKPDQAQKIVEQSVVSVRASKSIVCGSA